MNDVSLIHAPLGFLTNVGVWHSLLSQWNCWRSKAWAVSVDGVAGAHRQEHILVFAGFHFYPMSTIVTWGRWQYWWCYSILFHFPAVREFVYWGQQRRGTAFVGSSYFYSVGRERKRYQVTQDNFYSSQTWRDFLLHPLDVEGDCSFVSRPPRPK